jgi:NAD(P)-dependent dehydrogenase (short-subunit alcohol dehydrogenase family)
VIQDLRGKTAFITGGASGIGLGMAEAFVDEGMNVVIADIEAAALASADAQLRRKSNAVHAIRLDVTDRDAFAHAADEVERVFGNLHVLCNNAGVASRGFVSQASYDDWDWTLGVNIGGVVNGIRTFLPRMVAHGEGGHVVNTASMAGLGASPGNVLYSTTKFAVVGLSEGLQKELAPEGIGVTVLCPAAVRTNFNRSARNRPDSLDDTGTLLDEEFYALMDEAFEVGMAPRELGDMVVAAIRENRLYVIPHGEFRDAYKQKIDEILASWSDPPPADSRRVTANKKRQEAFKRLKKKP